jgi:hypothetical protein
MAQVQVTSELLPCPSCGFKHPKLMIKKSITKDMVTKQWRDTSTYTVRCPNCIMQAGPVEGDSNWPVKQWNKRHKE